MLMMANTPAVVGRDSILGTFRALQARFPRFAHHFELRTVAVAQSGELAVVTGTYHFVPDTLQAGHDDVGKYLSSWKKVNGQWRIAADMTNSDRSPPDAPRSK